ncbi:MAG: hypothetical protein HONBIEJF_01975 [Fimbriimonadaceae bacterium]|nr:hypothetical protein [Fimbriimonadaceae bacterium]
MLQVVEVRQWAPDLTDGRPLRALGPKGHHPDLFAVDNRRGPSRKTSSMQRSGIEWTIFRAEKRTPIGMKQPRTQAIARGRKDRLPVITGACMPWPGWTAGPLQEIPVDGFHSQTVGNQVQQAASGKQHRSHGGRIDHR